jgi:hypothetical protein
LGQAIQEVKIQPISRWRDRHLSFLQQSFASAPFSDDALSLVETVYNERHVKLGSLAKASFLSLCRYFGLKKNVRFLNAEEVGVVGSGSNRVLAIVKALGGSEYITGHGARNYLDHEAFEAAGVKVSYMQYQCRPYPQLHGPFTPYVSALDLVANCGRGGAKYICSGTMDWKDFLNESD